MLVTSHPLTNLKSRSTASARKKWATTRVDADVVVASVDADSAALVAVAVVV
jgi:hypothetical protein